MQFRNKSYIGLSFHRFSDLNGITDLPQLKCLSIFFFNLYVLGVYSFFFTWQVCRWNCMLAWSNLRMECLEIYTQNVWIHWSILKFELLWKIMDFFFLLTFKNCWFLSTLLSTIILVDGNNVVGSFSINALMDTVCYRTVCFQDISVFSGLEYILSQSSLKVYCCHFEVC